MWIRRELSSVTFAMGAVVVACGNSQPSAGSSSDAAVARADGAAGDGRVEGVTSDAQSADGAKGNDAGSRVDAAPPVRTMAQPTCTVPIHAADVSTPTTVVGTGSASSCTGPALAAAVAKGGVITFYCGAATIPITQTIQLPIDKDVVIDGGNTVALDGGGTTRIFQFTGLGSRTTATTVTLQHLDFVHGNAMGTPIPGSTGGCSQGYNVDGGGGAIYLHDGKLHVFDVRFTDNHAAASGPEVGGGAIYAEASLDVTIVGSTFTSNSASNGGAIRSTNSDLTLVNDTFSTNQATGAACSADGGSVDGGPGNGGGNSGAVGINGTSDGTQTICGCVFANNSAGAHGGAFGRSADGMPQGVSVDQTTFDGNTSLAGGGAMNIHNSNLDITASTISNNSAPNGGGIQADGTKINFVNDTFAGNVTTATTGAGGALALLSNGGTIQSSTFGDNHSDHVPGAFAAAISGGVTLTINDTIFWNNTSMICGSPMTCQTGNSAGQADLQWPPHLVVCMNADPACASGGTMFMDANLAPLGWNGGPTETMRPQAGSPAIGAGTACPTIDQRGAPRKADGCTVGAFEAQ